MSSDIFDKLVEARAPNTEPEWFAEILDRFLWLLDYEVYNVVEAYRDWLEACDDKFKVQIVLAGTEVFPFEGDRLKHVLDQVSLKWPELADQCERMWSIYQQQIGNEGE